MTSVGKTSFGKDSGGSVRACGWRDRCLVAAVGSDDSAEQEAVRQHLAACEACRGEYDAAQRTAAALRALAPVKGRDVTDAVLSRLPRKGAFDWRRLPVAALARTAAILLAAAGVGFVLLRLVREEPQAVPDGVAAADGVLAGGTVGESVAGSVEDANPAQEAMASARMEAATWLASIQRKDGTWDVAALGGRPEHAPALTALALMAMHEPRSPELLPAVKRGAEALLAMQRESGCFGGDGTFTMYNHGIATVALLRLHGEEWFAGMRAPLGAAVDFIREAQQPEGGWGYRPGLAGGAANASVSAWQLDALGLARREGWGDAQGHLRRGLFWLSRLADSQGNVGYHTAGDLPSSRVTNTALGVYCLLEAGKGLEGVTPAARRMAGRLRSLMGDASRMRQDNPYRDYFAALASEACGDAGSGVSEQPDAAPLRARLVASRVDAGAARGSWNPSDAYAQVGGRLYSTSLCALALRGE